MKRYSPPPGKDGGVSWKGGVPGGRRGCLQKSGLCTQAASLPFFFFFLLLLPGPQEIDTYIVQAKERSYETVLSFGKRGLNIAASAAVQAATKVPPPSQAAPFGPVEAWGGTCSLTALSARWVLRGPRAGELPWPLLVGSC